MASIPNGYCRVEGSERRPAPSAQRVGPADPDENFSITIHVRRRPGSPTPPDQDYWAANPPGKRLYITRQELATQYSAAQPDLDKVESFARSNGLDVRESDAARRRVVIHGTAEQFSTAFGVDLGRYTSQEESYRGHEGFVYLPADMTDIVVGVFGLDNRRVFSHGLLIPSTLTITQVTTLYNFPNTTCTGQTLASLNSASAVSSSQTSNSSLCL